MGKHVLTDAGWDQGDGPAFEKTCPATGETAWAGRAASGAQVEAAVASARRAFPAWAATPLETRIAILEKYAEELTARTDDLAAAISRDMGKSLAESKGEVGAMAAKVAISVHARAERAGAWEKDAAFGRMTLTHRPHGVMAVFGPFNFPGHLPNGHIVPALLAGNTCVFKPSELAPSAAEYIADAFEAAGLPPGVLNIVHGGRETGGALLNADVNGVLFTGSATTGVFFHKHFAGRPDVILALEMGGNNPLIIWDPADVEAAADIAYQSATLTTGQRCSCARRLILPKGAFGDSVIEALRERMAAATVNAWNEDGAGLAPLVSPKAATDAVAFQDALLSLGGQALVALTRHERGFGFVTPGLIDVTSANNVPDEELFGPLLQVKRVDSFDDALAAANDTRYGLSGGLVSDDDALWDRAYGEMRAGILNRNRPTAGAASSQPFGGPGLSGNFRPSAYYAADYCAWPQASQIANKAAPL